MRFFLFIPFILVLSILKSGAQTFAYKQDSLTLIQFQNELMQQGWPALWNTNGLVVSWNGISLDHASGKVSKISIWGDNFNPDFSSDSLPSCISVLLQLDSLKELTFGHLNIRYLPEIIEDFISLNTLGLGYNKLGKHSPIHFEKLDRLKYLFLNNNEISETTDLSIPSNLEYLNLSDNKSLSVIPDEVFTNTKLKKLFLQRTSVLEIPDSISNLTNLQELDISSSGLSIISDSIRYLSSLEKLNLSYNNLSNLTDGLGYLENLITLDISRNDIRNLPLSFCGLSHLKSINLIDNQLDSFPSVLTGLPDMKFIYGSDNKMKGPIPEAILAQKDISLYLENNELSGKVEIKPDSVPLRLYLKNNRFTFKDIIEGYSQFDGINNTIGFYPQQKIGTFRTFYPNPGTNFNLEIDQYSPAEGVTFCWYKYLNTSLKDPVKVSDKEILELNNFQSSGMGGIYYCEVKHPDLPDMSLQSNFIRVIGEDLPPQASIKDIRFRVNQEARLTVDAIDDYTCNDSLIYQFPLESDHFNLRPDSVYDLASQRYIIPKTASWTGTDTVNVLVVDENGNSIQLSATITVFPTENQVPILNIPDIYMNIYQDITLPCIPGVGGCNAFYPFVSETNLSHFITDDFTDPEDITCHILEADSLTGRINDMVNVPISNYPDGQILNASVFAYTDTVLTLTLKAVDREGGVALKPFRLIAQGINPNQNPQVYPIPEQIIYKGTTQFPLLNLNDYVKDDYLPDSLLTWRGDGSLLLNIKLNDSIAEVSPKYTDSIFTTTITYYVYEKTNEWRYSPLEVTYKVIDFPEISGTIKDSEGLPLENVELVGFTEPIFTDLQGNYEVKVQPGWSGKIFPKQEHFYFVPDTVEYSNVISDVNHQDYMAHLIPQITYQIELTITDGIIPLESASVAINDTTYSSDALGMVIIENMETGKYVFTVTKNGFLDVQDTVVIENKDIVRTTAMNRITSINTTEQVEIIYYPNPVSEYLTIEIPRGTTIRYIQICDINGKLIEQKACQDDTTCRISFSGYSNGIYLINLIGENQVEKIKVIKGR